jgi:ketosteroid isomerase-like protein
MNRTMTTSTDALTPLRAWFTTWNRCIVAHDFAAARSLFDPAVSGFGTRAAFVFGQDALEHEQWRHVWPTIRDFRFLTDALHGAIEGRHAWAAVRWTSTGVHPDGTTFPRPGRATVVLRHAGTSWRGVHTHFSLDPGTPPTSHGRSVAAP